MLDMTVFDMTVTVASLLDGYLNSVSLLELSACSDDDSGDRAVVRPGRGVLDLGDDVKALDHLKR